MTKVTVSSDVQPVDQESLQAQSPCVAQGQNAAGYVMQAEESLEVSPPHTASTILRPNVATDAPVTPEEVNQVVPAAAISGVQGFMQSASIPSHHSTTCGTDCVVLPLVLESSSMPCVTLPEVAMQEYVTSLTLEPCLEEYMELATPIFAGCPYSLLMDPFPEAPSAVRSALTQKYMCRGTCEWCKDLRMDLLPGSSTKRDEGKNCKKSDRRTGDMHADGRLWQRRREQEDGVSDCTVV